jgi:hypothetical protein
MQLDQYIILEANGEYLKSHLMQIHRLCADYHDKAKENARDPDKLILEFFKHVDEPNCLFMIVEEDGQPAGFLFALAHERMAFLNCAYLGLKSRRDSDTLKRECLVRFDTWARKLLCEEGVFQTMRGPYAHKWAEKFGWDYQMTIYHKNFKEPVHE